MSIGQSPRREARGNLGIILVVAIAVFLMFFWRVIGFVTDWFWFQEVGFEKIFTTTFITRLQTAAIFGIVFFLIFFLNVKAAFRFSARPVFVTTQDNPFNFPPWKIDGRSLSIMITAASIILGIIAALNGASEWEYYLKFLNATPFGAKDPIFQKDIGFYVFKLPFLSHIYSWLFVTLILTGIAVAILYFLRRSFVFIPPSIWRVSNAAKTHLALIAAALFLVGAFGIWLQLYEMLFNKRGVVFGPGYTDVNTQIWVLQVLIVVTVVCAATIIFWIFRKSWRIPVITILVFLALMVIGRGLYPAAIQKFKVIPNEVVLERPYLEHNIKYTRMAYMLDKIEDREFPATEKLGLADIKRNDATIKNIRLWDHGPLLSTYGQLQEIRTYYKFEDVDNDRYMIDNEYRQVAISPRELSYPALPSRTWVNEHMTYTHGYGMVMSPVNRITREGLPEFFIKDIPPVPNTDIKVKRPEIYYGETSNDFVFVKGKRPEFDYPVGDKNIYSRYEGKGGVPLSFFRKLLYAARFGSFTILLSDDIASETRVMYYRKIRERVSKITPFIHLDNDSYPVITADGRIVWFIDGYTVTDRFPYSEPVRGLGNYIRNSVKAVVDAYDGTVVLYVSDPSDPIIKTYAKIFPGVFKGMENMPLDLRNHIRYPQGIFSIQARMYRTYHMQDPQVFYNKEDLWSIPIKNVRGREQEMEPYYTILKFPGEKKEEFISMVPFTPSRRDNMSAWMAARCDAPNYGKVLVYTFPKQTLIYGPRQIEARIDQDTEISKQLSLWSQRGSQVIRGNLLAIPVENSIIYVESLYLAAEKGQLPELKRVILAFGNMIAMEESLELSIQKVFGGELIQEKGPAEAAITVAEKRRTDRQIALEALSHYRKAQENLRQGNWNGYGEELRKMDELLKSLEKLK